MHTKVSRPTSKPCRPRVGYCTQLAELGSLHFRSEFLLQGMSTHTHSHLVTGADRPRLLRLASYASVSTAACLVVLKLWAWQITDSVSLLSSLVDSGLDVLASLITFFAIRVSLRPADREHRFGHGKAEGLAALAQSVIITGSAVFVLKETIERLMNPTGVDQVGYGVAVMLISAALTLVLVSVQRYVRLRTGSTAIAADAMHYKTDLAINLGVPRPSPRRHGPRAGWRTRWWRRPLSHTCSTASGRSPGTRWTS